MGKRGAKVGRGKWNEQQKEKEESKKDGRECPSDEAGDGPTVGTETSSGERHLSTDKMGFQEIQVEVKLMLRVKFQEQKEAEEEDQVRGMDEGTEKQNILHEEEVEECWKE